MTTHYILLELSNLDFIRNLKTIVFNHFDIINKELCLKYNLNWYCDTNPHITLLGEIPEVSNNEVYRKLKYSDEKVFVDFKKKCSNGVITFPELIIDTFDNDNSRVLKINCKNCNIYSELTEIHNLLKSSVPNDEKYKDYSPHITLTYLKPDTSDSDIEDIKSALLGSLPKNFNIESIALSDKQRNIDRIPLGGCYAEFPGF